MQPYFSNPKTIVNIDYRNARVSQLTSVALKVLGLHSTVWCVFDAKTSLNY